MGGLGGGGGGKGGGAQGKMAVEKVQTPAYVASQDAAVQPFLRSALLVWKKLCALVCVVLLLSPVKKSYW